MCARAGGGEMTYLRSDGEWVRLLRDGREFLGEDMKGLGEYFSTWVNYTKVL